MRSCYFFIVLLFLTCLQGLSQNSQLQFEHISEGLSQSNVICILQDREGFMWFGTRNGLNKYDGYQFKIYEQEDFNESSLSYNWITSLLEDENGNIWVGTFGGGVNVFDKETETFARYQYDEKDSTSLSNDLIESIYQDPKGQIWIGTSAGLNLFDKTTHTFKRYTKANANLVNDNVSDIVEGDSGELWFVSSTLGVTRFNPETLKSTNYPRISEEEQFYTVREILKDSQGGLWIGTDSQGLLKVVEGEDGGITFKGIIREGDAAVSIVGLLEDSTGKLWVGSQNTGLYSVDLQTEEVTQYLHDIWIFLPAIPTTQIR